MQWHSCAEYYVSSLLSSVPIYLSDGIERDVRAQVFAKYKLTIAEADNVSTLALAPAKVVKIHRYKMMVETITPIVDDDGSYSACMRAMLYE